MRLIKFVAACMVTVAAVVIFNTHQPFGSSLPPLGKLINPFTGFWRNAEAQGGHGPLELDLEGLESPAEVVFDERMVPHIFAGHIKDAAFVQGYVTAMFRLWQLDMTARSASGRLSEVVGARALEIDRESRQQGMARAAENELKAWEAAPEEMALFQAYADGINTYIRSLNPRDYPVEYKLLDYAPEEWSVFKSALVLKYMARMLCFRADDIEATNTKQFLGEERFRFLFPEYNPQQSPVIPSEVKWNFSPVAIPRDTQSVLLGELWRGPALPRSPEFLGSNNWAVSGRRTATGYPMLSNDPHLGLMLPSIWFEVQIHTPEINSYGVCIPGTPGIIIGFNGNIAWGVTNVGQDVLDFYRVNWQDKAQTEYLYDNRRERVQLVEEQIRVRGRREPVTDTVKYTVWGPVVNRYGGKDIPGLAMRWLAHDSPEKKPFYVAGTYLRLMKARNYDDYVEALNGFDSPAQNFVFASRDGDIALRVNGKFPLKRPGQGRFIQDGSLSGNAWHGFIPRDQIPAVRNPARGFVASANQQSTDQTYPYYYNGGFDDYRGRLINRLLGQDSSITAEDLKALQNNTYSLKAEDALPVLLGLLDRGSLTPKEKGVLDTLEKWDYRFEAGARAPVAFVKWLDTAMVRSFDELIALQSSMPVYLPETWRFIELLQKYPQDTLFDIASTPGRETAGEVVTAAFRSTCAELASIPGAWGRYKATVISHLARIPAFSVPVEVGGYRDAPNAIAEGHGPSWRMIVELGPEPRAYGVYPGGQSGNPGSPFYDQMIGSWARGEYFELFFMRDAKDKRQPVRYTIKMK